VWRLAGGLARRPGNPERTVFQGSYSARCAERVWAVAYADPAGFAARAVEGMWRELGGKLTGRVRDGQVPAGLRPRSSPPLRWPRWCAT
jgi:D-alanyl-D-alanine carboxypeptidase/D-alanyl-D-alanine-endopeptidase (penicillin-binding protein 4)